MAQLKHRAGALRIAALYVVVSAAWILLSDRLLGVLAPDPGTRIWLQSLKGTLFVVASGILIYYMVRRALEAVARVEGVHQQREQWFQALIENISDAVTVLDRDGRVVYVSPAFERITGFALDERLGSNAFDRVHPEDRKTTMEKFQRLAEAPGAKVNARPRMRHKDGTWRITRLSGHNLLDDPAVGGIVVTYADVTRRVRIEKQLRKSEKRFRLMVEGSEQVFFYEHDAEGRFRYLSPSIRMVLGYKAEELLGRHYSELLTGHNSDATVETRTDYSLTSGNRSEPYTALTRAADGRIVDIELVERPLIRNGVVVGLQGFARDITRRNAAEKSLRENEKRFRSLIENSSDAVILLDRRGAIRFLSSSVRRLTTHDPAELMGSNAARFVHPEDRASVAEGFRSLLASVGEGVQTWEFRCPQGDGGTRIISATAANRLKDPTIGGIVVNARDVTATRVVEEQLRQAQKMEAVGRLAGGVAHDFNNIITAVKGYAEMVLQELSEGHPLRQDIEEIATSADRAASLTRQLLAFSRQQVLRPQVLDLNAVVADMQTMLRRLIGEHIRLETTLQPHISRINADSGQVQQVIMNLVVNARDAMPRGGRITIETRNESISPTEAGRFPYQVRPGPYVVLSVTDTGEGMDEGTMDHIFDPFFTTKPKGKGTGLGLSTVYGIVKQSGGYVWAESEPGCGTTFRVFLPRTEADIATDRVPGKNSSTEYGTRRRTGSGTVLVVEDERAVREFIVRVLTRAGYVTLEATHGTEALELSAAHEGTIDLLLTDVVMPGIGGSELARAIRRSRSAIRVLLMSGYTEDESIRASAGHSRQPFLEKPFSADDLLRVVSDILESASGQQRGQPG